MDDNSIGSLWQPKAFVREKDAYVWEVWFVNYITASLFPCQMEAIMFIIF